MALINLMQHPRWALYKKLRRAIARELEAAGAPHDAVSVDRFLADELPKISAELNSLFAEDARLRVPLSHG